MSPEAKQPSKSQYSEALLDRNETTKIEIEKHSGFAISCINYKFAVCLICSLHLMYQTVSGLYGATVSTIEQRFQLQSTEIGTIAGVLDISAIIGMLIVSIFGAEINKPKVMAFCAALMSVGAFCFAMPHLIAPSHIPTSMNEINLCGNVTARICQEKENMRNFRFVFMGSMALIAISWTIIFTLAIVYIDENTADSSAFYTGLFYAMGGAGPALGYILGGFVLRLYVNITENVQMYSSGWIGNWWLGYLICSLILLISATFVFFLPKSFTRKDCSKQSEKGTTQPLNTSLVKVPLTTAFKIIFTNKLFLLSVIGASVNFMFLNGFGMFGTKYLVAQYGLAPFAASLLFGCIAVFASVVAHVTSGIIISKLKLDLLGIIKYMVACCVISAICSCGLFFHCPDEVFATEENSTSISMQCNSACNCSTDFYEPVCGSDDVTYFSPCHAGCLTQVNETNFGGCECVQEQQHIAMLGKCESKFCMNFIWFQLVSTFTVFTSVLTVNPSMQVVLKTIDPNCRVLAVSFYYGLTNIFGVLPGRILTGAVIDLACKVWQTECDEQGSCVVYNRWEMARNMALTVICETSFMVLIYVLMLLIYKPMKNDSTNE